MVSAKTADSLLVAIPGLQIGKTSAAWAQSYSVAGDNTAEAVYIVKISLFSS